MTENIEKNMKDKIDLIITKFDSHKDWEDKYRELIKVGKTLNPMDETSKESKFEIKGCQSKVWLKPSLKNGRIYLEADSDAILVKGIIGLLLEVYSDSTPSEIIATPPEFLQKIGITDHLSMNRTNGLAAMVKQIQMYGTLFNTLVLKGINDADL
jgi:cysteine desulfuration protein SufE